MCGFVSKSGMPDDAGVRISKLQLLQDRWKSFVVPHKSRWLDERSQPLWWQDGFHNKVAGTIW